MDDDFPRKAEEIREPDPAAGHTIPEQLPESVSANGREVGDHSFRAQRQRVVLAEPGRTTSLAARVELAEQTSWGEVLINDLIKAQLRTGALFVGLTLLLLGALPALFYLSPTIADLEVIGLPVPWVLLVIAPFPLLLGMSLWYNRSAERHERDFVDMIEN